jgi:orotidine-5'-phosphate decarboxylase
MAREAAGTDRVFVALDVGAIADAVSLMDRLDGVVSGCKIGSQLFTAAGPAAVEAAHKRGYRVFLDLKFHDIPNTVAAAVREATRLGVFMLNVHASGGAAMMRAAAQAARVAAIDAGVTRPICLGVTVLTSLDRRTLDREVGVPTTVANHVLHLATLAHDAGLDGSVASPEEIGLLRRGLGPRWVIVTPGIRPADALGPRVASPAAAAPGPSGAGDDQVRTATPAAAIRAGADYIVIGRPITGASDPVAAARAITDELSGVR